MTEHPEPHPEEQYLKLLRDLIAHGDHREGRNGGVRSLFGAQMRFDLEDYTLPLLTTKRVHWKSVLVELLWFLKGDTNVKYLHDHGVTIWDEWADPETGELGPVYGAQWRKWRAACASCEATGVIEDDVNTHNCPTCHGMAAREIDQIAEVVRGIQQDPFGRRHIVSAWNVGEISSMALPPCHALFQFHVTSDDKLNCQLYQRSADVFLGVPFNIASYALLTILIARECGLRPGEFVHTLGDYHLYDNHVEQALEQLSRTPRLFPYISMPSTAPLFDLEPGDISLHHYDPHPLIRAEVSK